MKEYKSYENDIVDIDELEGTDIKINPDYYIHKVLDSLRDALLKDNLKEGLVQYRLLVEQAEIMVKASNMLEKDDYDEKVNEEKKKIQDSESDKMTQSVKLAQYKLSLLLESIFSSKIATEPAKI